MVLFIIAFIVVIGGVGVIEAVVSAGGKGGSGGDQKSTLADRIRTLQSSASRSV